MKTFAYFILSFMSLQLAFAQREAVLYAFSGMNDGGVPYAGLTFDSKGNLYGTTSQAGVDGIGNVFQLAPSASGWQETVLHGFTGGADGGDPDASPVIFDKAGNLYGTTSNGGLYGYGTVFELKRQNGTWLEEVLYNFQGSEKGDGQDPESGVTLDKKGHLYGTTNLGGPKNHVCPSGCGTIFELTHSSSGWKETIIHIFEGSPDGAGADDGLIFGKDGALYGTTSSGGTSGNHGTVFRLAPSGTSWEESILYRFTGSADGADPTSSLTQDASGNFYGTTSNGGMVGYGTVFRVSHSSGGWQESVLISFDFSSNGGFPSGRLIFDKAGNLYGTTSVGGTSANGTVYELSPTGEKWTETVLLNFDGNDGSEPTGGVILDESGDLYGTSSDGGGLGSCSDTVYGCGTVFEVVP